MKKIKSPPNRRLLTGHEFAEMKKLDIHEPITEVTDISKDDHPIVGFSENMSDQPLMETAIETKTEETVTEAYIQINQTPSHVEFTTSEDENTEKAREVKTLEDRKARNNFWGSFKKEVRSSEQSMDYRTHTELATPAERPIPMIQQTTTKSENADAIVSQTMTIKGDVDLDASLLIAGKIYGNVACNKHLETKPGSLIEGNVKALVANLFGGEIKGNVTCEDNLSIDEVTVVHGDLVGKTVIISGTVTGNITAMESVTLSKSATVKGNLISASISVEAGASLEGQYTVRKNID